METTEVIARIDKHYHQVMEIDFPDPDEATSDFFNRGRVGGFASVMLVPHIENYEPILAKLSTEDIICDMGAGDLRFALLAARKVKKVYAVEFNPVTIGDALSIIGYDKPRHLIAICCDWRRFPIPDEVTVVTCMVNSAEIPIEQWSTDRRLFVGVTDGKGGTIVEY